MTTYQATVSDSLYIADSGLFAGNLGTLLPDPDSFSNDIPKVVATYAAGQMHTMLPKTVNGVATSGVQRNFLYDKIYIDPQRTNLGSIVADMSVNVTIWNAFLAAVSVDSLTSVGDSTGISVVMPDTPPFTMPALVEQVYEFSFDSEGPATVAIVFTLTVDGLPHLIYFDGVRTRAWSFPHNWDTAVEEWLEWLTDFKETHTGLTQRAALRSIPRRGISYKMLLTDLQRQKFENLLFGWQQRTWQVPVLTHGALLSAQATAAGYTIPCVTADKGFVVGGYALISSRDKLTSESVQIAAVGGSSLTTVRPLTATWAANDIVYPSAPARVEGNVPMVRRKANVNEATISFKHIPGESDPWVGTSAVPYSLGGVEVMMFKPDWASGVSVDSEYRYQQTDYGTGVESYQTTAEYQTLTATYDLMFISVAEITAFRAFLGRVKGMCKSFYAPSWAADLTPVATINSAATEIRCRNNDFDSLVGVDISRAAIMIEDTSGNFYFRTILTSTVDVGDLVIGITALGATLTTAQVRRISYLQKYVLGSDKVVMSWHNPKTVTVKLPLRGVPV